MARPQKGYGADALARICLRGAIYPKRVAAVTDNVDAGATAGEGFVAGSNQNWYSARREDKSPTVCRRRCVGRWSSVQCYRCGSNAEADHMRSLPLLSPGVMIALLLAGSLCLAGEQPQLFPTRDVEVVYDVTRPPQKRVRERTRWLADEHLERVEGASKATTIFDRNARQVTLIMPANRSYRTLDDAPRRPTEPPSDAVLQRGGEAVVAGEHCVDWSWTEDALLHTVCATADGVPLRLLVDGKVVMEAHAVRYAKQRPDLFRVPRNYAPSLAPGGETTP